MQVVIYDIAGQALSEKMQREIKSAVIEVVKKYKTVAHFTVE